jgi:flagellin
MSSQLSDGTGAPGGANGMDAETGMTISTADGGQSESITFLANASAGDIAEAINTGASNVGVTASASNSVELKSLSAAGTISFNLTGIDGGTPAAITAVVADNNDLSAIVDAVNGASATGVTASFTTAGDRSSITLTNSTGDDIMLDTFLNTAGGGANVDTVAFGSVTLTEGTGTSNAIAIGEVTLSSSQGTLSFAGADSTEAFASASGSGSFASVAGLDISSSAGASAAITTLDAAIAQISSGRSDLGAYQNRFESVIASLQVASENAEASRSRIQDADFASETANLTKSQILTQAGISVLAQANAQPQQVLALLQ